MFVILCVVEREFAITSGMVKNIGVIKRLEKLLGVEVLKWSDVDPQIAGALGEAIFARAIAEKSR